MLGPAFNDKINAKYEPRVQIAYNVWQMHKFSFQETEFVHQARIKMDSNVQHVPIYAKVAPALQHVIHV